MQSISMGEWSPMLLNKGIVTPPVPAVRVDIICPGQRMGHGGPPAATHVPGSYSAWWQNGFWRNLIWMAVPQKADVRRNKPWPARLLHDLDSSLMSVPYHLQEGVSANRASSYQQPFSVSWTVMKQNWFGKKNVDESGQNSRPFPVFLQAHPEGHIYFCVMGEPTTQFF